LRLRRRLGDYASDVSSATPCRWLGVDNDGFEGTPSNFEATRLPRRQQRRLSDDAPGLETTWLPQRRRRRLKDDDADLEVTPLALMRPNRLKDSSATPTMTPLAWSRRRRLRGDTLRLRGNQDTPTTPPTSRQPGRPRDDGTVSRTTIPTSR
jgi:hypothetical protein